MSPLNPKIVLLAITKHGVAQMLTVAAQMPNANIMVSEKFSDRLIDLPNSTEVYSGPLKTQIERLFGCFDQIVFFVSLGAVVRLIAPHIKNKDVDPGVLVVDDAGQFVIPVLSGHIGGANAYAEKLSEIITATPVITTASDVSKTIAVDILGREIGWQVEAPKLNITRVSADVVNEEPIAFVQEVGSKDWWKRPTPLPATIHCFDRFEDVDLKHYRSILWVTHRVIPPQQWEELTERLVVYRPPETQL